MDLILWRHADALMTTPDATRVLSEAGRQQAARVADWLNPRLPPDVRVLASPATRALQTAQALGRECEVDAALAPGARADAVLDAAGWPLAGRPVLVVGHQPTLGQVAGRLLCGQEVDLTFRKAAVWWFQVDGPRHAPRVVLRAVAAPDWL